MRNSVLVLLLAAGSIYGQTLKVEPVANPTGPGSSQVAWSLTQDGSPLLSWVENDVLKYSIRKAGQWSEPKTIATKRHFFHHPAEVPEVIMLKSGTYLAHWIETPAKEGDSEAEFIYVSASRDGIKWSAPVMAHHDRGEVEHGLASMIATGDKEASIFWLQAAKSPEIPTVLMRSVISADGVELKEEKLDGDVCECCPTSVAMTASGPLVAYRDHTKEDIRDISVTRLLGGRWTSPKYVYADKWQVDACPVNAASAAAKGDKVAVSWYTAGGSKPRVELSLSADSGATFSKAVVVSTASAYGFTSIAIEDGGGAFVSWLERDGEGAQVLVRHVSESGVVGPVLQVAKGTRKNIGYPRLLKAGNDTFIALNTESKAQIYSIK